MVKQTAGEVLATLDNSMAMKNGDWLEEQLGQNENLVLLDLRSRVKWAESRIPGSQQVTIQDLPAKRETIISNPESMVICICNGSIQSAMAVVYLRSEGYKNSYNLSGGFSGWLRNDRPLES